MSRGFVVVTHNATASEQDTLQAVFRNMPWWHQMPQVWVLIDNAGLLTAESIGVAIRKACPNLHHYVFMATPGPHGLYYTGYANPEWHKWFYTHWKP